MTTEQKLVPSSDPSIVSDAIEILSAMILEWNHNHPDDPDDIMTDLLGRFHALAAAPAPVTIGETLLSSIVRAGKRVICADDRPVLAFDDHAHADRVLDALAGVAPAPVAVKALDFHETNLGNFRYEKFWRAHTPHGPYYIGLRDSLYYTWFGNWPPDPEEHEEIASAILFQHNTYERHVRACLVDAPVAAGWQAMETAPKDGRVILGYWSPESIETIAFRDGVWVWSSDCDSWREGSGPTHWMPLPAAPGEG